MRNIVTFPTANPLLRNSRIGSIGVVVPCSHRAKATSSMPSASSVLTISGLDQPASPARTRAQTPLITPAVTRATPGRSRRSGAPWLSGSRRMANVVARIPIGTLSQKIQCQLSPSVTTPPTTGPDATASPASPP